MINKEIDLGRILYDYPKRKQRVTLDIRLEEKENGLTLGISGSIWQSDLEDITCGGQIKDVLREAYFKHKLTLNKNISHSDFVTLMYIWDSWHLNDLNAGCEHQRKLLPTMTSKDYTFLITHPEFKECSQCGYEYGSKWLFEELPKDVIDFVTSFSERQKAVKWW